MRALITGGAGFIGSHLVEALLAGGDTAAVIDDLSTGRPEHIAHLAQDPRFHFVQDSITNEAVMDRLVSECDVVFHLAAAVGVELIVHDPVHVMETNILGTVAVLKVAARHHKKVIIASTSEVYGKSERIPFREDDDCVMGPTTRSRWSYAASKAVDELLGLAYHRQMGLPVVIARLFNTVGPRQMGRYGMVVPRFVQQALSGEPLTVYGDGRQSRCFCHVEDIVRALIALVESEEAVGEVFNVGSEEEITILELAERVLSLVEALGGLPAAGPPSQRVRFVSYDDAYEAGFEDMRRRVPDISKISAYVGWAPRKSLEETLQSTIDSHLAAVGAKL